MSFFSSLERSTVTQLVSRAGSQVPLSVRVLESCFYTTSRRSLRHRYQCSVATSVADVFISCLVKAGLCRNHKPNGRRFSTVAGSSSFAKLTPAQDGDKLEQKEIGTRSLCASTGSGTKNKPSPQMKDGLPMQESLGPGSTGERAQRQSDTFHYVPLFRETLPLDFQVDKQAYEWARRSDHEDTRNLFNFYLNALGEEEGTKSLQVVLSNPNREILLSSKRNIRFQKDITEIPGVERIVLLLQIESSSNQAIFNAYKTLPSPGVSYLSERTRGLLLHRFAKPPRRRRVDALRYLALIDDMSQAGLYISSSLWTAAIHLAGKSSSTIRESDLTSAVGLWRRMEYEGCVSSTSVAFNILFDIAIKAGQFKTAERVVKEMKSRGLDFSRFGKVACIFLRGLERNADGVRQAYHDFIKAGEIVDTVVLNCVMVSLIRAGEFEVAEQMYERMKGLRESPSKHRIKGSPIPYPSPSDNYVSYRKASKKLGRVLGMTAFLHDKLPDHHRALQAVLPLTPDAKTFHIFLSYYALRSGDLVRFMALLDDMEVTFSIPPQGMIYIFLFQGFAIHGSQRKTLWTFSRLRGVWASFLRALHDSKAEIEAKPRTKLRKAKLVWENPLRRSQHDYATGNGMDCPLESADWAASLNKERRMNLNGSEDDVSQSGPADADGNNEADDDWKYENSVYLGRRIIISCLRAFSVCGGPDAVVDVWAQIDRLWRSESQKMADIIAVKTVLSRLLSQRDER